MLVVSMLPVSVIILFDVRIVPTMCYFLFFISFYIFCYFLILFATSWWWYVYISGFISCIGFVLIKVFVIIVPFVFMLYLCHLLLCSFNVSTLNLYKIYYLYIVLDSGLRQHMVMMNLS